MCLPLNSGLLVLAVTAFLMRNPTHQKNTVHSTKMGRSKVVVSEAGPLNAPLYKCINTEWHKRHVNQSNLQHYASL